MDSKKEFGIVVVGQCPARRGSKAGAPESQRGAQEEFVFLDRVLKYSTTAGESFQSHYEAVLLAAINPTDRVPGAS